MAAIIYGLEKALENLLHRIADDYQIDYQDMYDKYMICTTEGVDISVAPPPKTAEKKKTTKKPPQPTSERPQCEGKTGKGVQCKKLAMPGCKCCAVHIPKPPVIVEHEEGFVKETTSDGPVIKKKKPVAKPTMSAGAKPSKKVDKPVHNHPVDVEDHDDCPACASHGNSTMKIPAFTVKESVQDRLSAILNSIGEETDDEDDDGEASVGDVDDN